MCRGFRKHSRICNATPIICNAVSMYYQQTLSKLVGVRRFELPTPCTPCLRSKTRKSLKNKAFYQRAITNFSAVTASQTLAAAASL